MDIATQFALRAILKGLAKSKIVGSIEARDIAAELSQEAARQHQAGYQVEAHELRTLAKDLGRDFGQ